MARMTRPLTNNEILKARPQEKDIFPEIGEIPVQTLKARTIVEALEPIKARGALETVRRMVQRINEIMIFAVNTGLIDANPASDIGMAFKTQKAKYANSTTRRVAKVGAITGYVEPKGTNSLPD